MVVSGGAIRSISVRNQSPIRTSTSTSQNFAKIGEELGDTRCSFFSRAGNVGSVWSPSAESRAQLKREHRWHQLRATTVWIAGIGAALAYWAVISTLIRWDQVGEILGLLTVVPIGMIVGNAVGNHLDNTHAARAARTSNTAR